MSERRRFAVTVKREDGWWMIHVPDIDAVSQARRLDKAESAARGLIGAWLDIPLDSFDIDLDVEVLPDLAARRAEIRRYRDESRRLDSAAADAAATLARDLADTGLSVRDIGNLLGLSFQRVHQIVKSH